jgi:acetyl esterase/lipase
MPSLKSRLVTFYLRRTRKKQFASAAALRERIAAERVCEDFRPPLKLRRKLHIRRRKIAGMPVYEVKPRRRPRRWHGAMRVVYMHGGAYLFQITPHHWGIIAEMAERLNARITVPIYPLAPEVKVERTFRKMMNFYGRVLKETPADEVVFMGDSAGAHMAVVLSMLAAQQGMAVPASQVLISPGLDMSLANPKLRELEKIDPWLAIDGGLEALRLCAPGMDMSDWRISPIYGDLSVLPKTLILTGSLDLLSADAAIFAGKAREAGVEMEFVLEEGMMHVWPLIDMPEARHARNRIVAFLTGSEPAPVPGMMQLVFAAGYATGQTWARSIRGRWTSWGQAGNPSSAARKTGRPAADPARVRTVPLP